MFVPDIFVRYCTVPGSMHDIVQLCDFKERSQAPRPGAMAMAGLPRRQARRQQLGSLGVSSLGKLEELQLPYRALPRGSLGVAPLVVCASGVLVVH